MSKQTSISRTTPNDILWGVAAIANYIGRERRQVYYMLSRGTLPAKKLGSRTIMARKSELDLALSKLGASDGE